MLRNERASAHKKRPAADPRAARLVAARSFASNGGPAGGKPRRVSLDATSSVTPLQRDFPGSSRCVTARVLDPRPISPEPRRAIHDGGPSPTSLAGEHEPPYACGKCRHGRARRNRIASTPSSRLGSQEALIAISRSSASASATGRLVDVPPLLDRGAARLQPMSSRRVGERGDDRRTGLRLWPDDPRRSSRVFLRGDGRAHLVHPRV